MSYSQEIHQYTYLWDPAERVEGSWQTIPITSMVAKELRVCPTGLVEVFIGDAEAATQPLGEPPRCPSKRRLSTEAVDVLLYG